MSLSGAGRRLLRLPASPSGHSRIGGNRSAHTGAATAPAAGSPGCASTSDRGIAGALDGVCRLVRYAAVPALLCLALLSGVATQAHAQTPLTVSFGSPSQNVGESGPGWGVSGEGITFVSVKLSSLPPPFIKFRYTVGGTATAGPYYKATAGSDFAIFPNYGSVSSGPPGRTETGHTLIVKIFDDNLQEGDETVVLSFIDGEGYSVGVPSTHTITIVDDDEPRVSFVSASRSVAEGSGMHDVRLKLDRAPDRDITVKYTVGGTATSGSDYAALSGTLSVPKGATTATIPVTLIDDSVVEDGETVVLKLTGNAGYKLASPGTHTLTIADDEPRVSFVSASQSAGEGSGTRNVGVTLDKAPTTDLTLAYTVDGTATAGSDYAALSGTVTVAKGATTATIPVTLIDDSVHEDSETVVLKLTGSAGYKVASPGMHTLTIADDEPRVSFASASWSADEGSGTRNVGVTLDKAPTTDLTLTYTVGGTATAGSDYAALSGTVTVAKGATTATIPVTIVDDSVREDSETVVLKLTGNAGYKVASPGTHTLTIAANDEPRVSFVSASGSVAEGAGTHDVRLKLDRAPDRGITLAYTVSGTATAGSDYAALSGTLSVPRGATTATVPVTIVDDGEGEDGETVVLKLTGNADYKVASPGTHTLTIVDNEPAASFALASQNAGEGSGTHDVTVNLSPAPASPVTLKYTAGGTATAGSDYTALSGTVSVPKGVTTATIPVTVIDDGVGEDGETVVLKLTGNSGYGVASADTHTLTIVDNEPRASFASASRSVTEGSGTHDVRLGLDRAPDRDITVAYTVGGTATAGSDFTALSSTVTVPRGAKTATVPVTVIDDSENERDETVVLKLTGSAGYRVGRLDAHTLTIAANDEPMVSFAEWGLQELEWSGTHDVRLTLDPAPLDDLTLTYKVSGTATPDEDYTALPGALTVPAGATAAVIPVTIIDDTHEDNGESVVLTLVGGPGYKVRSDRIEHFRMFRFHILNDDVDEPAPSVQPPVEPAVTIAAGPSPVTEGGNAVFTLTADPTPAADLAVSVTVAADGAWGIAAGSRTVTVPTTGSAVLTLATTGDDADEPDGSVTVTVKDGNGYTVGSSASGTVSVQDDDTALPEVTIAAKAASVTEGGNAVFTLTANPAPAADLPVSVSVAAAGDYGIAAGTQTVTIPASGSATLTLATAGDDADEPDGSVSVTVADGTGYTVGSSASGTVSVRDDDDAAPPVAAVDPALVAEVRAMAEQTQHGAAHVKRWRRVLVAFGVEEYPGLTPTTLAEAKANAQKYSSPLWPKIAEALEKLEAAAQQDQDQQQEPEIAISADAASVTEGGDAVFTLTASPAPAADLPVSVSVGTDGDYGLTAGTRTVTIPTTGSATLTLATTDDSADEPDGSVTVTVADGSGYTVGSAGSGTVAVRDDDAPLPVVTLAAGNAVTEGGDAVFTLTASPAPAADLAVSVSVAADGDWGVTAGTQTVTIPTTGSATLTLATTDDAADEPDGSVTATVQAGSGYTVGSAASGTVAVSDDDLPPPAVTIAARAASVAEGGDAEFTLTADRAPDADLTVTLAVSETGDGDHVAAADEGPATLAIPKGATEAVFTLATVNDDVDEPDGAAVVTVEAGAGYAVGDPASASVEVTDDDAAALPVLSVGDATLTEGVEWLMPFTVRLSAAAPETVTVRVDTRDSTPVSATRRDYWPVKGRTVTFRPGETERTVTVLVYDDYHDEDPETFEVVLSDARGAAIGDGVAVGTIVNDDPLPGAWLARFGRTVAEQALDGIAARMAAPRTAGMQGSIAGQALAFGGGAADGVDLSRSPGPVSPGSLSGAGFGQEAQARGMTMREVLQGSSFSLTGEADSSGGTLAFWGGTPGSGGLVSGSRFAGDRRGNGTAVSLHGETATALLGTDYARGRWLVGFALSETRAEGGYAGEGGGDCSGLPAEACALAARAGDGEIAASLTATIPYAALAVTDRLRLWGAAGQGAGDVTVKTGSGESLSADTAWSMAAAGLRGDLLAPSSGGTGPLLSLTSDAMWVRTSSEKTHGLAASESDVSRLRVGLEGSWGVVLENGGAVTPKLELGARHDGGDAETGFGVELGGGLEWTDPGVGLSLDLSGRTLVAHDDGGLEDRGVSAQLSFDPAPSSGRGLSLSLGQDWGGRASGGLDALFAPEPLEDRTGSTGSGEASSRWSMEAAYGLPAFGGRFTGSPYMGLGLAAGARDYSLGWRLAPEAAGAPDLSFGLHATLRESDAAAPEHTVGVELTARW